jgi:TPR repeat protein/tRNA A-37 threonylcarbamoyl transferase component Bud32
MEMIGHYEIRELLGEGGIGQVHVGYDSVLEREVAIKSLRPELLNDKNFVDRFRAEATSLARLNHPNITTLYSLLPEGRNLYMIMELVRGDTLDTLLKKRNGPLAVKESLAIIAQAADGLSYAHSMGIIHRDVKPANLMITAAGLLKIMDFGIARVRGSQRLTRDGTMVGTLAYMAPEQLRGEGGDERSDLYSLAIVLYELLTGATPFVADSDYDLMQAHVHAKPQRLIGRVPGLDAQIDAALMRALAKKPDDRFASVRAFSDALGATSLRVDAPALVIEGTRLMERPAVEFPAAPSSSFDRISRAVDPLLSWAPAAFRVPLAVGASTFIIAGVLVMGGLALMPSPVANVPAKKTFEAPADRVAVPPPTRAEPPPPPPTAVAPPTAPPQSTPRVEPAPAVTPPPPPEARPAGDFRAAFARRSYAEALAFARPAAERGERDAQFMLAYLYDTGSGTDRDEEKAAVWYQKAAEQGHALAQANLGDLYDTGRGGLPEDPEAAFRWYRRAADQGNAAAQNSVGFAYAKGRGTERDDFAAVMWYEKAARQNFAKALKNLGDMYWTGRGVGHKDDQQALRLYYQAAEQNHPGAEFNIGSLYENGFAGQPPDPQRAAQWYARAAEHGHPQAPGALERVRGSR